MLAYVDAIVRENTITIVTAVISLSMRKCHASQNTTKRQTRQNIKKDITTIFVLDLYDNQTKINDSTWQNIKQVLLFNYKQTQLKIHGGIKNDAVEK